jgi:hypothetical protein
MLSDNVDNIKENKSNKEEVSNLRKKIENLNTIIYSIKEKEDEENNIPKNIDFSNFVEISNFNDLKNSIKNININLEKRCEELERMIDEYNILIENKTDKEDTKNIEDNIRIKIDEFKNTCYKKFCEKTETYKQIKFLEVKLKTIEDKEKTKEKGDNWLIAKKPVNGYSCASCENYIGEIKDNVQPLNWKKFQSREQPAIDPQKNYRVN